MVRKGKKKSSVLIAFAGGGSGGHILPGIAVENILRKELQVKGKCQEPIRSIWLSSRNPAELSIIENNGVKAIPIFTGKLRRYFSIRNLSDIFLVAAGFFQSLWILARRKPVILFSKGGFASVPPVYAAAILGIPVIVHDSDLDPGLATKLTANIARNILVPYQESVSYYPAKMRKRVVVTGNPIRAEIFAGQRWKAEKKFGISNGLPVLLVVGGSQGATQLNTLVEGALSELCGQMNVIHITGSGRNCQLSHENYYPLEYAHSDYPDMLALADIVLTRAGAGALWEAGSLGKTMVLLPKGLDGSRGDQVRNAEYFRSMEAAEVLDGKNIDTERCKNAILGLLSDTKKAIELGKRAKAICITDSDRIIARILQEYVKEER